jgi:hypothetical protein
MPANVKTTATRKALPKPEILSHPLDTPVLESVVLRAAATTADVSGPYLGRRYMLAGTVLSKREDGTYEPYKGTGFKAGVNEVQEIKIDATGKNWKFGFDGETTGNLLFNLTAAELQVKIEELSNINAGDVKVTGGPGDSGATKPYVLTFGGQYAGTNVPQVTATKVDLEGGGATATASTKTAGSDEEEGSQDIAGVLFETVEFAGAGTDSNEAAAMVQEDLKLDENKIIGFAEFEIELLEWAAAKNNSFFDVSNAQEE